MGGVVGTLSRTRRRGGPKQGKHRTGR